MSTLRNHPVSVIIDNISVKIRKNKKEWNLLAPIPKSTITGGTVFAIMGGSGSGKTTLLNILADRYDKKNLIVAGNYSFSVDTSEILNGVKVGYVTQSDYLLPFLTVRETLNFAANLTVPFEKESVQSYREKLNGLIEDIILDLGLKECADTIVGSTQVSEGVRGISGGEKRRVSVAVQILADPSVLCLDEPTSGLDAFTANTVMQTLSNLAQGRRRTTVICSIHQPRSDIYDLFHSVMILSRGQLIYYGLRKDMLDYFSGLSFPCPPDSNPADYYIDITSINIRHEQHRKEDLKRLLFLIRSYSMYNTSRSSLPSDSTQISSIPTGVTVTRLPDHPNSWLKQVLTLTQRFLINSYRDQLNIFGGVAQALVLGLIIMGIFWDLPDDLEGIQSRQGVMYIVTSAEPYMLAIILIDRYCREVLIFDRELQENMYSPSAYFLSHFLSMIPQLILFPSLFAIPIYFGAGLRLDDNGTAFINYFAASVVMAINMNGLAWLAVSVSRVFSVASLIMNLNYTFIGLTTGFLVVFQDLPVYIGWFRHISCASYCYRILVSSEFSNRIFHTCPYADPADCKQYNGNDILKSIDVGVDDYELPWVMLFVIAIAYHLIALINLHLLRFPPVGCVGGDRAGEEDEESLEAFTDSSQHSHKVLPLADVEANGGDFPMKDPQVLVQTTGGGESQQPMNQSMRFTTSTKSQINIQIKDISLSVRTHSSQTKVLLSDINATVQPTRITALMGGSGSGKTTLLNLIAGRLPLRQHTDQHSFADKVKSKISSAYYKSGRITFNGQELSPTTLRNTIGYVQQFDFHLPSLTVKETLEFAALLRLPRSTSTSERHERVDEIIRELDLTSCLMTRVGGETLKGISGGERRRLSLGVQLLLDPPVCILDEPTTGLDTFIAKQVMETLYKLARHGRTVLLSIHQPRYDVFALLDDVILLSRGRQVWGGSSKDCIKHLSSLGFSCPLFVNPADFLLDISSIDFRSVEKEEVSKSRLDELVASYKKVSHPSVESEPRVSLDSKHAPSDELYVLQQHSLVFTLPLLMKRSFTNLYRQPDVASSRISQGVFYGLILCLFYAPIGDQQSSVKNRMGILYEVTAICFVGMLNCIAIYPMERNIFYREYVDGGYSGLAFFLTYLIICIPFVIVSSCCLSLMLTYVVGLVPTGEGFGLFTYVIFCFSLTGECIGIAFCSIFLHIGFSVNIISLVISVFAVMSGFISVAISKVMFIINHISPLKWGSWIVTNVAFRNQEFGCKESERLSDGKCIITDGEQILKLYNMYDDDYVKGIKYHVWVLAVLTALFVLIAYFTLEVRAYKLINQ